MKLLVLAAGYATRLRPLTDQVAKPLLPIAGRSMIDRVLDALHGCTDIDEVLVVTNSRYADDFVRWAAQAPQLHRGQPWRFQVFDDGTSSNEDRRGAIGDIDFVLQQHPVDDDLLIIAGDNLFTAPLLDFVAAAKVQGTTVGVYDVGSLDLIRQYNNITVSSDGRILHFEEKPAQPKSTLTAVALYFYPRALLPQIRRYVHEGNNPDQPGRLVQWLVPQTPCYAHRIAGRWLDIGSPDSYADAQRLF